MAKYLIDSSDIEIEEVSGTQNLKFNLASGNSTEQMIGDLSNLNTTDQTNVVNAVNEVNTNLTNLNTYSTTETPIGKWLGKTLYRKVVYLSSLPNATQISYDLSTYGINNSDLFINIYGIAKKVSSIEGDAQLPINVARPSENNSAIGLWIENGETNFKIDVGTVDRSNCYAYIIFEYTKTTD